MNSRTLAALAWRARRLSPTAAVVGTLIEPLVAAWLFAEPLTARQGVGALLLGAAMGLLALRRRAA